MVAVRRMTAMQCTHCGHDNAPSARFCNQCAQPLVPATTGDRGGTAAPASLGKQVRTRPAPVCPTCGTVNRQDVRFCEQCGQPLTETARALAEKRTERRSASTMADPSAAGRAACPNCGYLNRGGIRFCEQCGHSLLAQPTNTAAGPAQTRPSGTPLWVQVAIRFVGGAVTGFIASKLGLLALRQLLASF
jgi:predicted amidophosphoribosyltransferase